MHNSGILEAVASPVDIILIDDTHCQRTGTPDPDNDFLGSNKKIQYSRYYKHSSKVCSRTLAFSPVPSELARDICSLYPPSTSPLLLSPMATSHIIYHALLPTSLARYTNNRRMFLRRQRLSVHCMGLSYFFFTLTKAGVAVSEKIAYISHRFILVML